MTIVNIYLAPNQRPTIYLYLRKNNYEKYIQLIYSILYFVA
jgi:hypothetical protein